MTDSPRDQLATLLAEHELLEFGTGMFIGGMWRCKCGKVGDAMVEGVLHSAHLADVLLARGVRLGPVLPDEGRRACP